ncbi:hypothetical protein Ahy_B04g068989 [Arachis hypogaea]|uniref:Uncharacterized protein n=1 Tax=Arachis hypogaea TaxID=3818 RepID=A0A444ZBB5_ARAHY|nr:hypothetical protein Ahy_B04g068989 [Arachis hypogaea]
MGTRKKIQHLFNPLVLPSFILVRLVNIYMFRCHNKLLFLTSDFGGSLFYQNFKLLLLNSLVFFISYVFVLFRSNILVLCY